MGMDVRSSYIAVPPPREIASEAAEDGTAGVARGRHMRITGVVTFISLASAAACTAAWFGGSQGGRTLASLRSQVRLEEEKECKAYEKNIDYRGLKDLRQIVKVSNSRKCRDLCSKEAACAAWTWGRLRNVFGFSDVCFLKQSIPGGKAQKYFRFGAVAGVKTHTLCEGTMEEPPSMLIGHVQSRDGMCLEAFPPVGAGSQVSMASCMDGKPTQEWTYTEKSGQMKNGAGLCLDAIDKVRPFVRLQMYPCDSGNWSQQWMFDNDTGLIKSWRGACIDAAERNIEGGMVYIQTCNVANQNQQWLVGAHGPEKPQRQYPAGTLYCFALMLPDSYETDLLRMQHRKGVSLFACDAYSVYSNKVIQVGDVKTGVVNSDLKCGKGGEFGTALNLDIFLAVWTKVVSDAVFEHHDWTVKVDQATTVFPTQTPFTMQLQSLVVAVLVAAASGSVVLTKKSSLDINQKVYIENEPVLGDGAGESALGTCQGFARQHVVNPDTPHVKVCGTGIKATFFLRGRCEGYYEHSKVVGKCNSKAPPSTCDEWSPANDARFGHYQSFLIEQC